MHAKTLTSMLLVLALAGCQKGSDTTTPDDATATPTPDGSTAPDESDEQMPDEQMPDDEDAGEDEPY